MGRRSKQDLCVLRSKSKTSVDLRTIQMMRLRLPLYKIPSYTSNHKRVSDLSIIQSQVPLHNRTTSPQTRSQRLLLRLLQLRLLSLPLLLILLLLILWHLLRRHILRLPIRLILPRPLHLHPTLLPLPGLLWLLMVHLRRHRHRHTPCPSASPTRKIKKHPPLIRLRPPTQPQLATHPLNHRLNLPHMISRMYPFAHYNMQPCLPLRLCCFYTGGQDLFGFGDELTVQVEYVGGSGGGRVVLKEDEARGLCVVGGRGGLVLMA